MKYSLILKQELYKYLFVIGLLFFLNPNSVQAAKNFIPNGGFELHTLKNFPDAWDQFLGPKEVSNWHSYWSLDSNTHYGGEYSLHLSNDNKLNNGKIFAQPYLNAQMLKLVNEDEFSPSKTYTLSLYMKSDRENLNVKVKYLDTYKFVQVGTKWKRYIFTAPFEKSYRILIVLYDIGNLWIDNVQLEEGDTAHAYTSSIFTKSFFELPQPDTSNDVKAYIAQFESKITFKNESASTNSILTDGKVFIDTSKQELIVDGQPFFYFGACFMVAHTVKERWAELLDLLKQWGYTVIVANFSARWSDSHATNAEIAEFLDLANERGLKVIIWISPCARKDENGEFVSIREFPPDIVLSAYLKEMSLLIPQFKSHPALIAWYVCDEPWRMSWIEAGLPQKFITAAKILDKSHPVFINYSNPYRHFSYNKGVIPGDIISQTEYPVPTDPLTIMAKDAAFNNIMGYRKKPVIFWFQLWSGKGRYPTPEEFKCMIYLSLIHGTTGFQTWPMMPGATILWNEVKNVIGEVKTLFPYILSDNSLAVEISGSSYIFATSKIVEGKLYIVAVNALDQTQESDIKSIDRISDGNVLFEDRQIHATNGQFHDIFLPYERHVYIFDLPNVAEPKNVRLLEK